MLVQSQAAAARSGGFLQVERIKTKDENLWAANFTSGDRPPVERQGRSIG
jgi:hypothetical protein